MRGRQNCSPARPPGTTGMRSPRELPSRKPSRAAPWGPRSMSENGLEQTSQPVHRPLGPTFYRYVALEALRPTIFALLGLTTVVLTKELLGFSILVINRGLGVGTVALIAFYKAVPIAALMFPFSVLLGCLVAMGRLGADREILTLEANGIAAARLVWPVIVFAAGMTALSVWPLGPGGAVGGPLPGRGARTRRTREALGEHPPGAGQRVRRLAARGARGVERRRSPEERPDVDARRRRDDLCPHRTPRRHRRRLGPDPARAGERRALAARRREGGPLRHADHHAAGQRRALAELPEGGSAGAVVRRARTARPRVHPDRNLLAAGGGHRVPAADRHAGGHARLRLPRRSPLPHPGELLAGFRRRPRPAAHDRLLRPGPAGRGTGPEQPRDRGDGRVDAQRHPRHPRRRPSRDGPARERAGTLLRSPSALPAGRGEGGRDLGVPAPALPPAALHRRPLRPARPAHLRGPGGCIPADRRDGTPRLVRPLPRQRCRDRPLLRGADPAAGLAGRADVAARRHRADGEPARPPKGS